MNFFEMFKNLVNQDEINTGEDDITVDKIISSEDFDDSLIAAWWGFK